MISHTERLADILPFVHAIPLDEVILCCSRDLTGYRELKELHRRAIFTRSSEMSRGDYVSVTSSSSRLTLRIISGFAKEFSDNLMPMLMMTIRNLEYNSIYRISNLRIPKINYSFKFRRIITLL